MNGMKTMTNKNNKQVFDVSRPGKNAPSPSSRPIIIGHGPPIKDSTVNDEKQDDKFVESKNLASTTRKKISPLDEHNEQSQVESKDEKATKPDDTSESKPETENQTSEKSQKTDTSAAVDALADEVGKSENEQHNKELTDRKVLVKNLVQSKTYFLPIGHVSKKSSRITWVVITVLFLIAIIAYLIIDADIIKSNIDLPIDLINNDK
jgi:cation transport ATPase